MKETNHYEALIGLLAVFTEADNRLTKIQTQANEALIDTLDGAKKEYAELQAARDGAEAEIKDLAKRHPEWLADSRTIKTPYGTVKFTETTSLEIPNPEVTLTLIKHLPDAELRERLIRTVEEPAKEALEAMKDDELAALGVRRIKTDSVTVKAAKVEMGKAGKPGTTKETKAKAGKEGA
jgi:hypothetical protein